MIETQDIEREGRRSLACILLRLEGLILRISRLWFCRKLNGIEKAHADIMKK
jgi:hypothetical protein